MIRMIRKLGTFVALAGAILFACWNPAVAQTPGAPCLTIDSAALDVQQRHDRREHHERSCLGSLPAHDGF